MYKEFHNDRWSTDGYCSSGESVDRLEVAHILLTQFCLENKASTRSQNERLSERGKKTS